MTISFADAAGNLMNVWGKLGAVISELDASMDVQESNYTNTTTGIVGQLNDESDIQAIAGGGWISTVDSSGSVFSSTLRSIATAILNRVIYRDNPLPGQTLTGGDLSANLAELVRQMDQAGASVLEQTITATAGAWTGTGTGVIVVSTKRASDGLVNEHAFAEDLLVRCTTDSYSGPATLGQESFSVEGEGSVGYFAHNWPKGSGSSVGSKAIDGNVDATGGNNLLTNSGWDAFTTANDPDNWELVTGTAGTHWNEEVSITYDGASALRLEGDGTNLSRMDQLFGDSTAGTSSELAVLEQYAVNLWMRRDGTAASQGVLQISLVDGNNNTIPDENGVDNSFTIDLTALSTDYVAYNGVFRTPSPLPAEQRLRIELTTPLEDGRSVYLDKLSMGVMTKVYAGGVSLSIHSGAVAFERDDQADVTVTNSRGSGGTLDTFQTLMLRLIPTVLEDEIVLLSSSTPTISDNLIG